MAATAKNKSSSTRVALGKAFPVWLQHKEIFDAKKLEAESVPHATVMFPEMADGQQPLKSKFSTVSPSEFMMHLLDVHTRSCSMCKR